MRSRICSKNRLATPTTESSGSSRRSSSVEAPEADDDTDTDSPPPRDLTRSVIRFQDQRPSVGEFSERLPSSEACPSLAVGSRSCSRSYAFHTCPHSSSSAARLADPLWLGSSKTPSVLVGDQARNGARDHRLCPLLITRTQVPTKGRCRIKRNERCGSPTPQGFAAGLGGLRPPNLASPVQLPWCERSALMQLTYSRSARRSEASPKKIIRPRNSYLMERMKRPAYALQFGDLGGVKTGSTRPLASSS